MDDSIHIAVLQADPLAWFDENQWQPVPGLDFEKERERILDSLNEARRVVNVRFETATADVLRTLLTLGCRALHYSGHGMPDFLAFENGRGAVHPLEPGTLHSLLAAGGNRLRFVFVSACHSRRTGEAFVAAGAPHVVAVRLEEPVFDIAAREFARAFYLALLVGKTVFQAFEIGRAAVKALPDLPGDWEAEKFLLLPQYGAHDEVIFTDLPSGEWRDRTPPPPPLTLPAPAEYFLGRELDMHRVVEKVLTGRLVTVRGLPGIGKTALAIAAARYLGERRLFRDGVFFVNLRGVESAEAARFVIATTLEVVAPDDGALFNALRSRRALLVLDNCEDGLNRGGMPFRRFIAALLGAAKDTKILATSRQPFGAMPGVTETLHDLHRLDPIDAARLFLMRAPRELTISEVGAALPRLGLRSLAGHPVLRFLAGHPLAIALAAPLLADKTLSQLAALLEAQNIAALAVPGLPTDDRDASLAATLAVSVGYVRESNPDAVRLFALMGLLPGGALAEDVAAIWGQRDWSPLMDALVRGSLMEKIHRGEAEYFSTFPFFAAYAESLLAAADGKVFSPRILDHFSRLCQSLYPAFGSERAQSARSLFALHEPNLRACLNPNRLAQPWDDDGDVSPTGTIASLLPQMLLLSDRPEDGMSAAELGLAACKAIHDTRGEANTLRALGDLKVRLADLAGARADYETALPIYRGINDRLGEANTLQSLGNLALASGDPHAAFAEYRRALEIHTQIQAQLGVAADFGYMARAAAAGSHARAVMLCEQSLSILRAIQDRFGQALSLQIQAESFWALKGQTPAFAARWLARDLFRAIGSPSAKQIDGIFAEIETALGADQYRQLIAELEAHAEGMRLEGVEAVKKMLDDQNSGEQNDENV